MQKTILVTGASSGIGKAASLYFAAKGWNVIAAIQFFCCAKKLLEHASILVKELDVTDITSIENIIIDGIDAFGGIDIVLNNGCELTDAQSGKMPKKFNANISETINVMRAILPHFRIRNRGIVVNVNSAAENITVGVYEPAAGNIIRKECFSGEVFVDLRSSILDYFDSLLD